MESILGSNPIWSSIPGFQKAHEQVDRNAGEHGEVHAVAGEGDGQVRGQSHGRSRFAGSPDSQVSGPTKRSTATFPTVFFLPYLRLYSCNVADGCLVSVALVIGH